MVHNPAVPTDSVLPHLYYRDADAAARWLDRAFGFEEVYRVSEPDGRIHIAQLRVGRAYVMIRYERGRELSPLTAGGGTQSVMVIVDDVDGHHAHATEAGVEVDTQPTDMVYGVREYSAADLEGHRWTFAQQLAAVDPAIFSQQPA